MGNLWNRFGCFLTGYNYRLIKSSSEASAKAVKKYLSAILIVATLWGFIGYAFTQRYLHGDIYTRYAAALLMIIMVIQIERQIILSIGKNSWAFAFRILIGIVMAIIGSVILDQIIFKEDVEKAKISNIQTEVNRLLPIKTQELTQQIQQLDNSIKAKENERTDLINDIVKNPRISMPSTSIVYQKDSTGKMVPVGKTVSSNSVANPKADLIPPIDAQIKYLQEQKTKKENEKLNVQQILEDDLKSKVGFLDELKVLFSILFSSGIALFVWLLLFCFFLAIELFVLVNKFGDAKNDYDKIIIHQMDIRIKMLEQLADQNDGRKTFSNAT
jgi:hypothetical protein